jgi:PleD family two-component response regulator
MDKKQAAQPTLLVVDDDHDLCEMLTEFFGRSEYQVVSASWGEDALRIAAEQPLSLAIIDIHLPDINGYDLCRQLRDTRRTQDLPIIFLTERSERADKLHGLELGVVDYITKPFDTDELLLRVRNAIHRATQTPAVHPVTELPDVSALDERLNALLADGSPWALFMVGVSGLDTLREIAGFVAADEVLRAIALILRQAAREDDFLAHLDGESLVLIAGADRIGAIRTKVEGRLALSVDHFYHPPRTLPGIPNYLKLSCAVLTSNAGRFADLDAIKQALAAASVAVAS